ncbi:MAG: hypothetical protein C4576_19770 [Desulfobacteraceae bacterium]|nr:MAG: hypothetical protein C4576_19770 [Desulfobacteraceae bacterium]
MEDKKSVTVTPVEERLEDVLSHLKKVKDFLNFITTVYESDASLYQMEATLLAFDAVAKDALRELEEATSQATYAKGQASEGAQS